VELERDLNASDSNHNVSEGRKCVNETMVKKVNQQ